MVLFPQLMTSLLPSHSDIDHTPMLVEVGQP